MNQATIIQQMIDQLKQSNEELENLREFCSKHRSRVMRQMRTALKYGYTYVDLDTLDGVSCVVIQNKKLIEEAERLGKGDTQ